MTRAKAIAACLAAVVGAGGLYAYKRHQDARREEVCPQVADYAALVMRQRQTGADMERLLSEATNIGTQAVVREAFSAPGYDTQAMQDRAVLDFKNRWLGKCLDGTVL